MEAGTNFTPAACSLVVLNVVMQNVHIFKDARQYNQFKKHCCTLKAEMEAAPGPGQSDGVFSSDENSGLSVPPKCWTYKLSDQAKAEVSQDIASSKLDDLDGG